MFVLHHPQIRPHVVHGEPATQVVFGRQPRRFGPEKRPMVRSCQASLMMPVGRQDGEQRVVGWS